MKIHGPHPSMNTYRQLQQQQTTNKKEQQKDQLNISDAAKKMQESQSVEMNRTEYVKEIQDLVQSGEYRIEPDKIAQKMVDFWSKNL